MACFNPPNVAIGAIAVVGSILLLRAGALGLFGSASGAGAAAASMSSTIGGFFSSAISAILKILEIIWHTIRDVFGWIIRSAPKFIQIIFFLLLFWLFGSFVFNSTIGLTKVCHPTDGLYEAKSFSDAIVYRLSGFLPGGFGTDVNTLISGASWDDNSVNSCDLAAYGPTMPSVARCFVKGAENDKIVKQDGTEMSVTPGRYYYRGTWQCTTCTWATLYDSSHVFGLGPGGSKIICLEESIQRNTGSARSLFCDEGETHSEIPELSDDNPYNVCQPPQGFIWESSNPTRYKGVSSSAILSLKEERENEVLLTGKAIEKRFTKSSQTNSVITFVCEKSGKYYDSAPRFKIGGIDIFDIRVIGIICAILALMWMLAFLKIIKT